MLHFKPCIPEQWNGIKINYDYDGREFVFEIIQENEKIRLIVNGEPQDGLSVALKVDNLIEV